MILTDDAAREYINRSKYFKAGEFECRCGCGGLMIDTALVDLLDDLRGRLGAPVSVNSGYRCESHNGETEGSAKASQHSKGRAADVATRPLRKDDIIKFARELHFSGIGVNYKNFVHLDVREGGRVEF